jgi:ectoine hydroxylase-related dioxygenase (phytanoyl-CoA dioxygenase family)
VAYATASDSQVEFFQEHGYLVVSDAVDPGDLDELTARCQDILAQKDVYALDWAWEKGKSLADRDFKIVQSSPTLIWPQFASARFRVWSIAFASALMRRDMEFWYDQFLGKPPGIGAPTYWHQDEAYWGRNLDDLGITCWMPLHDVDERNGCMHFIDGGHRLGVLPHEQPPHIQSDLLRCAVDETRMVA